MPLPVRTWDEVYYYLSSELQVEWFRALKNSLLSGNVRQVLSQEVVDAYWLWDSSHNPHPPLYKMLSAVGLVLFGNAIGPFIAYRLATAALAAGLVVLVFAALAPCYGLLKGLYGGLCLLVIPLFFGHAHIAATEIPLAFFWFAAYGAFWKGMESWRGSMLLALLVGCGLATKFTAVLIPVPMLLWALLCREKRAIKNLMCLMLSPCIAVVLNPGWWYQPFDKISAFIHASLSRQEIIPISSFFAGVRYVFSPPWYYSPVMLGITLPAALLITVVLGAVFFLRYPNRRDALFLLNIPWILGIVMLPQAPVHDGIRQFFSVLPFCAYLSALGLQYADEAFTYLGLQGLVRVGAGAGVALLFLSTAAFQVVRYHPFCLSYYNELIGGLSGAYQRGMEVTYWFDAVTPPFLERVNHIVPDGARVCVLPANPEYFHFLQERGKLKKTIEFLTPDPSLIKQQDGPDSQCPVYVILLHRRSELRDVHRHILASCTPLAATRCDGVPLVALYRW